MRHGLTDEQRVELAKAMLEHCMKAENFISRGDWDSPSFQRERWLTAADAAVAFLRPLDFAKALAEPTPQESILFGKRYAVPGGCKAALMGFVTDRLAALILTREPDPAIEAVKEFGIVGYHDDYGAAKIVAAVDAARARKAGE